MRGHLQQQIEQFHENRIIFMKTCRYDYKDYIEVKTYCKEHSEILLRRMFLHSPPANQAEKERKISLTYEEQTYISDSAINTKPCILKCCRIC